MSNLNLLTINDELGAYPASYYAHDKAHKAASPLAHDIQCEICIIGGGLTGLSAALSLAKAGKDVVLLEASLVGYGASGRNGGQIGIGQRCDQWTLEKLMGKERARNLFFQGVAAHDYVLKLCQDYAIDIGYKPSVLHTVFSQSEQAENARYARYLQEEYGYNAIENLSRDALNAYINSPVYEGGLLYKAAGHGDPLALVLGLFHAAKAAGARIYENSPVISLNPVRTNKAQIHAQEIILSGNGYLGPLHKETHRYVLPINNFMIATERLDPMRLQECLPGEGAIADSKFVVNYLRRSWDNRLLFGGGESYGYRFPKDFAQKPLRAMVEIFPSLHDVKADFAWGGTLAITRNRLPFVRRYENLWVSSGYSGHGVALATYNGDMLARAILGDDADFENFAQIPHARFPGNSTMRQSLLFAAMHFYAMRDRLGV